LPNDSDGCPTIRSARGIIGQSRGDSCLIEDCETLNCTGGSPTGTAGIILYDSANCEVRNPKAYGNTNGVAFVSDSLTTGCFGCAVVGGNVNGNTTTGIYIGYATTRTRLVGANADYNPTGIEIDSATGTCSEVLLTNCSATGCSSSGLTTTAATPGIKARNLDVSGGGNVGINLSSDFDVSGLIARGGNPTSAVYLNTASQVRLADVDLQSSTNGWVGVTSVTSARVLLSGQITLDGTSAFGLNCASSTILVRELRVTGAGAASGTALQIQTGSTLRIGAGCDFSAINTQINNVASASTVALDDGAAMSFSGTVAGGAGAVTGYLSDAGTGATASATAQKYPWPRVTSLALLWCNIITNTMSSAVNVTVYKNNVATGITVAVGGGSTGEVQSFGALALGSGDTIDLVVTNTAGGAGNNVSLSAGLVLG